MLGVSRKLYRTCLLAALSAAVFNFGCNKKPISAPPPTTARTEAPAPRPTVTFQADPTSVNKGESSTLSWSTTNATSVAIAPEVGPVAAEGSTKVAPADSATYTLTATGPGGSADASVRITIATPTVEPTDTDRNMDKLFGTNVQDAYFDLDKAEIRPDARAALAKTAEFFRNYPPIKATIEGHCDERGSTEYNLGLGDRRATAVKQYLVSLGIAADRLSTVSYGKEKPFCMEASEACYQQNRRGHFVRAN
jgi:peptidoglycan-associated lipoprotein